MRRTDGELILFSTLPVLAIIWVSAFFLFPGFVHPMSSISGKVGFVGQTNYSAAKAGIVGLSKAAAKEVAHLGVRVNVIQPGLIRTAMTEAMPQNVWERKLAEVPMQRAGEPDEIASVALFYASDLSSYMTGTVAEVTGGRYM